MSDHKSGTWVNFRELRKSLSFEKVLEYYGVTVKKKPGNRHMGFCPLPTHEGKKKSASFSAKLDHGVWQCFGCKASGNIFDFAVRMQGLKPQNATDVRTVALKLQDVFGKPTSSVSKAIGSKRIPATDRRIANDTPGLPVVVNPPLDFELQNLDFQHPYLIGRGFERQTVEHFGLGVCNRGLMRGRVVIPLHDPAGQLVGYAGRLVDDNAINSENPKYLLPGRRERGEKILEFRKSLLLYGVHRLKQPVSNLIVVEGFASVWWLHQWGYSMCVSLLGSDCSEEQAKLIVSVTRPDARVWVLTDADRAGDLCAASVVAKVSPHRWIRCVNLAKGQPTDCTPGDLEQLLLGLLQRREVNNLDRII